MMGRVSGVLNAVTSLVKASRRVSHVECEGQVLAAIREMRAVRPHEATKRLLVSVGSRGQ